LLKGKWDFSRKKGCSLEEMEKLILSASTDDKYSDVFTLFMQSI